MRSSSIKRATILGGAAALLLACSASPTPEGEGRTASAVGSTYTGLIKSVGGYCLDVFANDQQTGAAVDIATCNGTTAQTFTFTLGAEGPIVNTASGLCLDDVWGGGVAMQMVTCMGTPEQTWTVWGAPTAATIEDNDGHCVDVLDANFTNGDTVDPDKCNGTIAQVWALSPSAPVCGGSGELACANGACNSGLTASGSTLICCPTGEVNSNNKCVACGASGQLACPGDKCNSGLGYTGTICCPGGNVDSGGSCTPCGANGELVCSGNYCDSGTVASNGKCVTCGGANGPTCPDNVCNAKGTVADNGKCVACGGKNEPCCGSSTEATKGTCSSSSLLCEPNSSGGDECISSSSGGSSSGGSSSGGSSGGGSCVDCYANCGDGCPEQPTDTYCGSEAENAYNEAMAANPGCSVYCGADPGGSSQCAE